MRQGGVAVVLSVCTLIAAAPAQASFEQVNTFGQDPVLLGQPKEGLQLLKGSGTAVNVSGAGGVAPGTVYAVAERSNSVAVYTAQGEFLQAWGWGVGDNAQKFERCGPDGEQLGGEPAYPVCVAPEISRGPGGFGGDAVGALTDPLGVAVDQATGNVYVLNSGGGTRKHDLVQVFNADGTELLGGFGEPVESKGGASENIEESPEKFHVQGQSLAVDSSGRVYVPDGDRAETPPPHISRTMIFEPEGPGDFEHYVYSGRANDVEGPSQFVAVDDNANLYLANEEQIQKLAAGDHHLLCQFNVPGTGLWAMTVDPASGEPFYYRYKDGMVHHLGACAGGAFGAEVEKFGPKPKLTDPSGQVYMRGLSFNPSLSYESSRPPGILYILWPSYIDTQKHQEEGKGFIFAPTAVHAPEIDSESILEVGVTTAVPQARVNPKGSPTNYVFQYVSDAAYEENEPSERFAGAGEAPPGGADLESGVAPIAVSAVVQGLQPDTEYHYRVVAENCAEGEEPSLCTTVGAERSFRTFAPEAPGPSNHRAFELVSPTLKNGGEVFPADPVVSTPSCLECKPGGFSTRFPKLSSPDGERVVYDGEPFSFVDGGKSTNEYFSRRTSSGWKTETLTPVLMSEGGEAGHRGFNRDLDRAVLQQVRPALAPSAPSETPNLYTQAIAEPLALTPLLTEAPPNEGENLKVDFAGASTDLSHVFFSADDALTGETPFAPVPTYAFNKKNLYESVGGQLRLVNVLPDNASSALDASFTGLHAISDDGSHAFWSSAAGQVYVREDGETTREIPASGKFLTASADGSKALLDSGELYDLDTDTTTDLTVGKGGFLGVAGQSEDLSRIYFADTAVLDETPNGSGDVAAAGKNNLYSWHEGVTTFIATLPISDDASDWARVERTAKASPNGRWLTFRSLTPLTGFDNVGNCKFTFPSAFLPGPCSEIFLYDAESGELRCPSCASSGEAPRGNSSPTVLNKVSGSPLQASYLTDEGRLYFDTANRLAPNDSNGVIEDVYEFEPDGVGSCERPEGCVSLVSSGHGSSDANLLIVDETGKNVFFTTRDQLTIKDNDDLIDLYDAREGGGIEAESESLRAECQGEACQPAAIAPNDPTPSSAGLHGNGNVAPTGRRSRRCSGGKHRVAARGKTRCVPPKRRHKGPGRHRRTKSDRGGAK